MFAVSQILVVEAGAVAESTRLSSLAEATSLKAEVQAESSVSVDSLG